MSKILSNFLLFVVVILVILALVYYHYENQRVAIQQNIQNNLGPSITARYNDHIFGFSFTYFKSWTLNRDGNVTTFGNTDQAGDTITIVEVKGNTVSTSNDRFGSVTYVYTGGRLMTTGISTSSQVTASTTLGVAKPLFTTGDNWPVLPGTSSAKTDIVFIPGKGFIIVDSGKSGYTGNTDLLVKSFTATSSVLTSTF